MHFGHKNVIKFDNRPFNDVDERDAELIRLWNSKVSADDHVYIIEYMHNKGRALNAGCMLNGFTPASFEELIINNQSFWEDEIDD